MVPDGPLLALPFGMLLTGPADAGSLRDAPWLIRRHAVSHAPSVQALVRLRAGAAARAPRAPRAFVGFGDFAPPSAEQLRASFPAERCGDDARALREFGRLPGTRREVEAAAGLFGGDATRVLGTAFTGAAVRDGGLSQYRIVLFATHGLLPTDLACVSEPSLMVSPPAGARDAAAALFTASAVTRLELNADLAVLSACNTAGPGGVAGAEQASEALSGLARAFFVAGARGLLATQWLANDAVAPLLVASTLSAQEAGLPTAEALRQVQLSLVRGSGRGGADLSHPVFWAPFVLLGDGVAAAATPGAARVAEGVAGR